jgi:hypothetical protein
MQIYFGGRTQMTRDFLPRLRTYFDDVAKALRGEARPASIFPNPTDVGMAREDVYANFLRQHLPANCVIAFGGFLFDQTGQESGQIDIIVSEASVLQFNFYNQDTKGKTFACVDGCVAAASVKSKLDRADLFDSLENLASIPDKQSIEGRYPFILSLPNYEDYPYKVIYASEGIKGETIYAHLLEYYTLHPDVSGSAVLPAVRQRWQDSD